MNYGNQQWQCTVCDSTRQWGNGFPEYVELFVLQCRYCQKAMPHKFIKVDHDVEQPRHDTHVTRDAAPLPYDRVGFNQKKEAL